MALLLLPVTLPLLALPAVADEAAVIDARLPQARSESASAYDGRYVYTFGGVTPTPGGGTALSRATWRFDKVTETVDVLADMPAFRTGASGAWVGDSAYVFGGVTGNDAQTTIFRYQPSTGVWTTLSTNLPERFGFGAAVSDGTVVYLLGGRTGGFAGGGTHSTTIWKFDPATEQVTVMPGDLPNPRSYHGGTWDGQRVLLFGGSDEITHVVDGKVFGYDPAAGVVSSAGTVPEDMFMPSAVWTGGAALVFAAKAYKYIPSTSTATQTDAPLPARVSRSAAAWTGSAAYILGGSGALGDTIVRYEIKGPNTTPVAVIAPLAPVECTAGRGVVQLDGSASYDPDGDALQYAWTAPGATFDDATVARPTGSFPLGSTTVTLTVKDGHGGAATTSAVVRVVDTLPPAVAIPRPVPSTLYVLDYPVLNSHDPRVQWRTIAIGSLTVEATAQDQCGPVTSVQFASNQAPSATDSQSPYEFVSNLRVGAPVVVTITARATDLVGNSSSGSVTFDQQGTSL